MALNLCSLTQSSVLLLSIPRVQSCGSKVVPRYPYILENPGDYSGHLSSGPHCSGKLLNTFSDTYCLVRQLGALTVRKVPIYLLELLLIGPILGCRHILVASKCFTDSPSDPSGALQGHLLMAFEASS